MDYSSFYVQKICNLNNIVSNLNKQIIQLNLQLQTERMEKEWYKSLSPHNNFNKNNQHTQTPIIYLKECGSQFDNILHDVSVLTESLSKNIEIQTDDINENNNHQNNNSQNINANNNYINENFAVNTENNLNITKNLDKKLKMNRALAKI